MARRLGWLSGLAALVLALARLGRLLQPQTEGPAWEVVLGAAVLLGAVATWTMLAYRLPAWLVVAVNLLGATLAAIRVAAPSTLVLGVVPTSATPAALREAMSVAFELIRFGAAPVLPVAGLVALLTVVFWGLGAFFAAGAVTGRPLLGAAPALAFYLQLATLDRRPPGFGWTVAFALVTVAMLLAAGASPNPSAGRARDPSGSLIPRRSASLPVALAAVMLTTALVATDALAATVPESGVIQWRTRSGIGSGLYGGTSFNVFVGLQQDLVELSDEPMFYARVSDSAPPNRELYWRLITLDSFDGENFTMSEQDFSSGGEERWEREDWLFQGPTVPVAARVRIAGLRQNLLPMLYSPTGLETDEELIEDSFRVREDAAVGIDVRTKEGWEYQLQASVPQPDVARLASVGGELSPIFAEAAEAGVFEAEPPEPEFVPEPEDLDRFEETPDDLPLEIRTLAQEVTADGITRFEKALLLESWFRDPANFSYSVDVSTGHSSLDLAEWLLVPDSRNFRTGYCEQFATAFAVMARTLGIPSRVVLGFTPGDVETQADGSEVIVVRENNAHAWVELWMDGQGWVRFDPTPRSDGVNPSLAASSFGFDPRAFIPEPDELEFGEGGPVAPAGQQPGLDPRIDTTPGELIPDLTQQGETLGVPTWIWWAAGIVAAMGAIPTFKWIRRRRRLARFRHGDVTAAWDEIVDRLRDLGVGVSPDLTPLEIAERTHTDLKPLARLHTQAVFGDAPPRDGRKEFSRAEALLQQRYQPSQRVSAWLSPSSLRRF